MSNEKKGAGSSAGFWLLCGLLSFSGLGLVVYGVRAHKELWEAIGHGLLIAGLLAATVDGFIKRRLVHEIAVDAQKFLTGYRLPEEIQESISDLMRTDIVRRNYALTYTLTAANSGSICIRVDFSYEIENLANDTRDYTPQLTLEKEREFKVTRFACRRATFKKELEFEFTDEAALRKVQTDTAGATITQGKTICLPRHRKNAGPSHTVSGTFLGKFPAESCDVYWFELVPVLNVSVRLTPCDFHFEVRPLVPIEKDSLWEYNRLFLPGDSIRVYWKPKSPAVSEPSPAALEAPLAADKPPESQTGHS